MAFFSKSNFLAPFHNKIHIVTIVLVAVVYFVFRSSGGSVSTTNEFKQKIEPEVSLPKIKKEVTKEINENDDLESSFFFRQSRKENNKVGSNTPSKKSGDSSGKSNLDDIYKELNF